MEISRHAIRECAFQTLFALASDPEIDREAIYAERLGLKPDEEVPAYLPELVNGVLAHQDELDCAWHCTSWNTRRYQMPWLLTKPYAWHMTSAMKSRTALSMVF